MDKMVTKELKKDGRRKHAKLAGKKERGIFLDCFCEITSLTRKYAQKVLSGKRGGTGKGRRKNKFSRESAGSKVKRKLLAIK